MRGTATTTAAKAAATNKKRESFMQHCWCSLSLTYTTHSHNTTQLIHTHLQISFIIFSFILFPSSNCLIVSLYFRYYCSVHFVANPVFPMGCRYVATATSKNNKHNHKNNQRLTAVVELSTRTIRTLNRQSSSRSLLRFPHCRIERTRIGNVKPQLNRQAGEWGK